VLEEFGTAGQSRIHIQSDRVNPIFAARHSTTLTNPKPTGWDASLRRSAKKEENMNKEKITKWAFHLLGAVCAAGTITLLLTFCSEVLFRDRGALDQSLMTWEDFYGAVITTLLTIGFLFLPFRSFSLSSPKVWVGALATATAVVAGVYVMVAPVELPHFHSGNFMIATGLLSFVSLLWIFSGLHGKSQRAESGRREH
jgi:hypothetical protein